MSAKGKASRKPAAKPVTDGRAPGKLTDQAALLQALMFTYESMVELCDVISESYAKLDDAPSGFDARHHIGAINHRVWRIRWELSLAAGPSIGIVGGAS